MNPKQKQDIKNWIKQFEKANPNFRNIKLDTKLFQEQSYLIFKDLEITDINN